MIKLVVASLLLMNQAFAEVCGKLDQSFSVGRIITPSGQVIRKGVAELELKCGSTISIDEGSSSWTETPFGQIFAKPGTFFEVYRGAIYLFRGSLVLKRVKESSSIKVVTPAAEIESFGGFAQIRYHAELQTTDVLAFEGKWSITDRFHPSSKVDLKSGEQISFTAAKENEDARLSSISLKLTSSSEVETYFSGFNVPDLWKKELVDFLGEQYELRSRALASEIESFQSLAGVEQQNDEKTVRKPASVSPTVRSIDEREAPQVEKWIQSRLWGEDEMTEKKPSRNPAQESMTDSEGDRIKKMRQKQHDEVLKKLSQ